MGWWFKTKTESAALLNEEEINQLISQAPERESHRGRALSKHGRSGNLPTSVKGAGTDFAELRPYHKGDDPRRIDWRSTARSQSSLVRTYHTEFDQIFCVMIDRRASMRFATQGHLKVTQAVRIALWLLGRETRAGRVVAAFVLDSEQHWIPAQMGVGAVQRIAEQIIAPCPPINSSIEETHWNHIVARLQQHLPRSSELILLSDFAGLKPSDKSMLSALGQHCATTAIKINDTSELQLPKTDNLQLCWQENSRHVSASNSHELLQLNKQLQSWHTFVCNQLRQSAIRVFDLSTNERNLIELGRQIL